MRLFNFVFLSNLIGKVYVIFLFFCNIFLLFFFLLFFFICLFNNNLPFNNNAMLLFIILSFICLFSNNNNEIFFLLFTLLALYLITKKPIKSNLKYNGFHINFSCFFTFIFFLIDNIDILYLENKKKCSALAALQGKESSAEYILLLKTQKELETTLNTYLYSFNMLMRA